jgi:membrane protease YdiL (CAAX protease family)
LKHPRKVHLFYGAMFYGFIGAAGIIWIMQMGQPSLADLFTVHDRPLTYGLGIGAGLLIAGASTLIVKWFGPARTLEQEFGWLLSNQNVYEIAILAVLSGVAEEIVFRGAIREMIGPYITVIIFAAAHPPFNSRLIFWPFFALVVGIVFEMEFVWTGKSLVAPILTHITVNFINLLRISIKFRVLEE